MTYFDPDGEDSILGIHTNVYASEKSLTAGHAWISVRNLETNNKSTYGLWPDSHELVGNNGPGSDVRKDIELRNRSAKLDRYYYLDSKGEV